MARKLLSSNLPELHSCRVQSMQRPFRGMEPSAGTAAVEGALWKPERGLGGFARRVSGGTRREPPSPGEARGLSRARFPGSTREHAVLSNGALTGPDARAPRPQSPRPLTNAQSVVPFEMPDPGWVQACRPREAAPRDVCPHRPSVVAVEASWRGRRGKLRPHGAATADGQRPDHDTGADLLCADRRGRHPARAGLPEPERAARSDAIPVLLVPRPPSQNIPETASSPILRRLSRPRISALRLATSRYGTQPLPARDNGMPTGRLQG